MLFFQMTPRAIGWSSDEVNAPKQFNYVNIKLKEVIPFVLKSITYSHRELAQPTYNRIFSVYHHASQHIVHVWQVQIQDNNPIRNSL